MQKDGTTGAYLAELEDALSHVKAPFKATLCENVATRTQGGEQKVQERTITCLVSRRVAPFALEVRREPRRGVAMEVFIATLPWNHAEELLP